MITFDDVRKQSEVVQRSLDAIANLLAAAALSDKPNQLAAIKAVMEVESERLAFESEKFSELMKEFREKRENMTRMILTGIVLVLLALLLVAGMPAVAAQDTLATNTPAAAVIQPMQTEAKLVAPGETPAPMVNEPSDRTLYVAGFIVFLALYGISSFIATRQTSALLSALNQALNNKRVIDEAQQRYMESSLPTQEFIKLLTGVAGFIGASIPGEDLADKLKQFGDQVIGEKPSGDVPGVG